MSKTSYFFPWILLIFGLQFCQAIEAVTPQIEGELTFEKRDNWDYAAKVAPLTG